MRFTSTKLQVWWSHQYPWLSSVWSKPHWSQSPCLTRTTSRLSLAASLAADNCLEMFSNPQPDPLTTLSPTHTILTTPRTLPNPSSPCCCRWPGVRTAAPQWSETEGWEDPWEAEARPPPTQQQHTVQGRVNTGNTYFTMTHKHKFSGEKYLMTSEKYLLCWCSHVPPAQTTRARPLLSDERRLLTSPACRVEMAPRATALILAGKETQSRYILSSM